MTWYLYVHSRLESTYDLDKFFIKLEAKTLKEAKKELGLIVDENNYDKPCLIDKFYSINEVKLFYVKQEVDLIEEVYEKNRKVKEFDAIKKIKQEKEDRYKRYLELQKEFDK